jgi:mRNA-degrading endonuclease YafQ of YafQ-DinJ toxin-antitoxin module
MNYSFSPYFFSKLRKQNVRVRNSFKEKLLTFSHNPNDPQLNNHPLKDKYAGFSSINVTNDYRAIYRVVIVQGETIALFTDIDTHEGLYGSKNGT